MSPLGLVHVLRLGDLSTDSDPSSAISDSLSPPDSQVEIDAKIAQGYFSTKVVKTEDLHKTVGRMWEELDH